MQQPPGNPTGYSPYPQNPHAQQPYAQQQPYPQQQPYAQQQPYGAPPQQPGAAQSHGMQGPAIGLSLGGGLRYRGGDFDPQNLWAAVTSGRGFAKPRLFGAGLVGLAAAFVAGNYALVHVLNRFYPYLYSLAAVFSLGGLWLLLTGQPKMRADGAAAPTWGRFGLGLFLGIGVLLGVAMIVLPWEGWL
jgi:hypothetical protein